MKAMKARYLLDAILTGLIIFELLYQYTGNLLHEIVGALFGITVIVHVALSHKWIGSTTRKVSNHKPLKTMHKARLVLAIILCVLFILLAASSIAISHQLSALTGFFLMGTVYDVWVLIHLVSSYAFAAVTVVHLAIHWTGAFAAFKVPYNPERRRAINASVGTLAAIGLMAVGASALTPLKQAAGMAAENLQGEEGTSSTRDAVNASSGAQQPNVMNDLPATPQDMSQNTSIKGGKGRRIKDAAGTSSVQPNDSNGTSARPDSSSNTGTQPMGGAPSSSNNSGSSGSSSNDLSTQICTLCRERCPLSAPKCDRPYLAGLISR